MEDSNLWDQLRNGDKIALKEIYELHVEYLFNYGRKIFQDTHVTEDSIQELFVEIWEKRNNLGATDSIRRYLATSLRRKIVARYKKESKSKSVDQFDQIDFQVDLSIDELIISDEISKENAAKLQTAFKELSARQREVLYLRFYQNMDYDEIVEVTGIKYQSLRNLTATAIKRLRKHLSMILLLVACYFLKYLVQV